MQQETSNQKYNLYVTEISVCQGKDNPIFGETVTKVRLQDVSGFARNSDTFEAGGMFLEIVQEGNDSNGYQQQVIRLEFEELLEIVKAAGILERYAKNYQQVETEVVPENQPDDEGWVMNPGYLPVDNDVQVEVEYRCGDVVTAEAEAFRWVPADKALEYAMQRYDIIKYRIIK